MRIGLIADVHANLEALLAVLGALDELGCERLICAGDVVGYGASPNECARELAGRGAATVAGNHDLMALGRMALDRCIPDGRRAIRWTRRVLDPEVAAWLQELPGTIAADGLVVCHGSLDDPDEYVSTPRAAARQLGRLRGLYPGVSTLVAGHT